MEHERKTPDLRFADASKRPGGTNVKECREPLFVELGPSAP
jgi:hypothetical protein